MGDDREGRLIQRLVEISRADERVAALLLYGSRATGSADEHSDVDFGLVPADDAYEAVVADGPRIIAALGEPLFLEWFDSPSRLHAILADGAEIELIIDRASEVNLALPYRVLLDRGVIADLAARETSGEGDEIDPARIRALVQWFWHDVGHLITALARGRTWWAYGQLEQLRSVCVRLDRVRARAPLEDDEPYWKVDETLEGDALAWLAPTIVPPEPERMREAGLLVVEHYRATAMAVCAAHGLDYPRRLDALLTERLTDLRLGGLR